MTDHTPDPEAPEANPCLWNPAYSDAALALPAFSDNYLWLKPLGRGRAVAVDPGDAAPVEQALAEHGWVLSAILLTHHHDDHVGGVARLAERCRVPVYGPRDDRIPATDPVAPGQQIALEGHRLSVLGLAGHTATHIGWHLPESSEAFVGDTLFALGCGRLFEGTPAQMWAALCQLMALPSETWLYAAHEYTTSNLRFARWLFPDDPLLRAEQHRVEALRAAGKPTLPTLLSRELALNPFLRMRDSRWRRALAGHGVPDEPIAAFARVRTLKDTFR